MNKKKLTASVLAVIIIFIVALRFPKQAPAALQDSPKQPIKVSVKVAADSKFLSQEKQFPATVVGDQEIKITAKSAGTVIVAPGNIGSKINAGALLAKIDDAGSLDAGEAGLKSLQVQQSELAAQQAKKSYELAKDNYDNLKKSADATSAQKDSVKTQRDIANLQYENATLSLSGTIDNHSVTSPISGVITNKAVSVGDSVAIGQLLATISKSTNIKIQFYVDQDQRTMLTRGQEILATDTNGNSIPLLIQNIAIAADQTTKRFLIEAYPEKQGQTTLLAGTISSVSIKTTTKLQNENNFLLPLSAINVGQNESYIFVADNNVAKKIIVTVANVNGETAEISSTISPQTRIITDGNKLIQDGESIVVQN